MRRLLQRLGFGQGSAPCAVTLRDERDGRDRRRLTAYLIEDGTLVIDGHDLGPGTALISDDGEYEWRQTFPPDSVAALGAALGGKRDEDILDLLARRYRNERSYDLERIMRETRDTIPREFWSWSA
jgi:hypothetical protein